MPSLAQSQRFHSLDALRAIAMLLGIFLHAVFAYIYIPFPWVIFDQSKSILLTATVFAIHAFRMEVFYLLAGFFAHMLYHRKGSKSFLVNRFNRIVVPLILFWVVLYPMILCIWAYGHQYSLYLNTTNDLWNRVLHQIIYKLTNDIHLSHLWFLYYLAFFYIVFIFFRYVFVICIDSSGVIRNRIDLFFASLVQSNWKAVILAVPVWVLFSDMVEWGVHTPSRDWIPHVSTSLLYLLFFGFGWVLHRNTGLLRDLSRDWLSYALIAIVLFIPVFFVTILFANELNHPHYSLIKMGTMFVHAVFKWLVTFSIMGFFIRYYNTPSPTLRYITDSSYWLYLVHLPLVAWLQVMLIDWNVHWSIKVLVIHIIAIPILLGSYHYLVRPTWVGVLLNGRRYPIGKDIQLERKNAKQEA